MKQTCDFCQSEFEWTTQQVVMDLQLRMRGSGLGACCPSCEDKIIAAEIKSERLRRRRARAAERREQSCKP